MHRALRLSGQRRLIVDLLLRDELARAQIAIALEVDLRVVELRAIARQRALGLMELRGERPRIDLRQQIALVNELALGEVDLVEPAVDLRAHRHLLPGGDGAEPFEPDRHVSLVDLGERDRHRARGLVGRPGGLAAAARGARADDEADEHDGDDCNSGEDDSAARGRHA